MSKVRWSVFLAPLAALAVLFALAPNPGLPRWLWSFMGTMLSGGLAWIIACEAWNRLMDRPTGLTLVRKILPEDERRDASFHEAAHVVAAWFNPDAPKPTMVKVVREAVGDEDLAFTAYERQGVLTEAMMRGRICAQISSRALEMRRCGQVTTGPREDLRQATETAREMVMECGMFPEGSRLKLRAYASKTGCLSQETAADVDAAISRYVWEEYCLAERLVKEHLSEIDKIADAVFQKEELGEDDLLAILGPRPTK